MTNLSNLLPNLPFLSEELKKEIYNASSVKDIPENTTILREGQYVQVVPIVLNGAIKVFARYEEKDLLLYYIRPNESCIMTFNAGLQNEPSKVFAEALENTTALLLPVDKISGWLHTYPAFNTLFYQQYHLRYSELLDTINHILFDKMDTRVYEYLKEKAELLGHNPIKYRISKLQVIWVQPEK
ncbi:Crp/Fnr family transcriptional regulator [Ascidiimonas aurantiaca]|uniref:Crp/Fnr family transcriptional regulator n=1 Tax=Ascidiimonas aurantiaca TaxID=1685432 RepID=UPI0030EC4DCF